MPSSTLPAARRISDEKDWRGRVIWRYQVSDIVKTEAGRRVVIQAGQREWNEDGSKILRLVEHYCLNLNKLLLFLVKIP